jgi:hypothetical protein
MGQEEGIGEEGKGERRRRRRMMIRGRSGRWGRKEGKGENIEGKKRNIREKGEKR